MHFTVLLFKPGAQLLLEILCTLFLHGVRPVVLTRRFTDYADYSDYDYTDYTNFTDYKNFTVCVLVPPDEVKCRLTDYAD